MTNDDTAISNASQPSAPLLGPDDPPPFERLNAVSRVPVLLLCDHASNVVPARLNGLGLSPAVLRDNHIAWDIGAAALTRALAERFGAPAILSGYSRLVIDCNRQPGSPESIPVVSDGIEVPGNRALDDAAAEQRAGALFWPYHQAIGDTLAALWRHGPPPAVLVVHSFTPTFNGLRRPWELGVLWNHDPRLAQPLLAWFAARQPELCVGDNQPYSGRQMDFTLERHAGAAGLPHAALEIRQDLIDHPAGVAAWTRIVGDALEAVLSNESLHRVQHY